MVEKKLAYYKKAWNQQEFTHALDAKEKLWISELTHLLSTILPSFAEVKKEILQNMQS